MPASDFSLTHTLDCHRDDLITQCHIEIRDVLSHLATLGYLDVVHELVVCDEIGNSSALIAIADLGIRRIWVPQAKVLFGV